jgi:lysine biosynthesis protein LysW
VPGEVVTCRSCGREIRLRRGPQLGQRLACPACGTQLEVIGLTPLEVDWAFDQPIGEAVSETMSEDAASEANLTPVPPEV